MRLHKKNLGFQWQDAPTLADVEVVEESEPNLDSAPGLGPAVNHLQPQYIDEYNALGAFVYPDAFDATEVAAVVAALDPLEALANSALSDLPPDQPSIGRQDEIVFSAHVVEQSAVLKAFAQHPIFLNLCRDLLGDNVRLYWDQLVYKNPDTPDEFPWHQDNGYTYVEPQQYLTCWVALTDATVDNGCPWIVPAVHRQGTLEHKWTALGFECLQNPPDAKPLELTSGSIAVFSSLTPHRTGPNLTNSVRKSYILQYAPDGAMMHPHFQEPLLANNAAWQFPVLANGRSVE